MAEKSYTRKYAKDFNFLTRLFQIIVIYGLFAPIVHTFYNLKIEGRENFVRGKKYIFSPNHISYFDPFLAAIASADRLAFMAKIELFTSSKFVAKNLFRLGAFGVNREKLDISTIKTVKEVARTNWSLGIFPQGGIRKNRKIDAINKGFTVMAKMMKRDIVPMSIVGCETYNWNIFKRPTINIKIGKPISWELDDDEIIRQWRETVAQMTGYELVNIETQIKEEIQV